MTAFVSAGARSLRVVLTMCFAVVALVLLGVERLLCGWIYQCPESFKRACHGPFAPLLHWKNGAYWRVAKFLGVAIKVFQYSVVGYDLLIRGSLAYPNSTFLLLAGLVLAGLGQLLNAATYKALGAIGVYYGIQLGYAEPWCAKFPYNLGVADPQYWGVVMFVWGIYISTSCTLNVFDEHFVVPWLETFWYVLSMKLLEDSTGARAVQLLGTAKTFGKTFALAGLPL